MGMKRNDFDAVGAGRMTDTELSKKLGSYQRTESIGILLGVILVITGCIMTFVYRNIIVICILVFAGGAIPARWHSPPRRRKSPDAAAARRLLPQGADKAFGPSRSRPRCPSISVPEGGKAVGGLLLRECTRRLPRGERSMGLRSPRLTRELRRTVGGKVRPRQRHQLDDLNRDAVPRASWSAARTSGDTALDIALNDMFQERKKDDITDLAAFRKHFAAHTADGREANDQVTPQLRDLVQKLGTSSNVKVARPYPP